MAPEPDPLDDLDQLLDDEVDASVKVDESGENSQGIEPTAETIEPNQSAIEASPSEGAPLAPGTEGQDDPNKS